MASTARADETVPEQSKGFYATLGLGAGWPLNVGATDSMLNDLLDANTNGTFSTNGGFAGEIGAGYDFGDVRAELTYVYQGSSFDSLKISNQFGSATLGASGNLNSSSVFVSGYYDIPIKNSRFIPYVGGGIGYTNLGVGSSTYSYQGTAVTLDGGNTSLFGYQAKVGVTYIASKAVDVFLEGVYQGAPGFSVDTTSYDSLNVFGARLGARYRF